MRTGRWFHQADDGRIEEHDMSRQYRNHIERMAAPGERPAFADSPDLRDKFAAAALTGLLAAHAGDGVPMPKTNRLAEWSYDLADAMLAARRLFPPTAAQDAGDATAFAAEAARVATPGYAPTVDGFVETEETHAELPEHLRGRDYGQPVG